MVELALTLILPAELDMIPCRCCNLELHARHSPRLVHICTSKVSTRAPQRSFYFCYLWRYQAVELQQVVRYALTPTRPFKLRLSQRFPKRIYNALNRSLAFRSRLLLPPITILESTQKTA